MIPEDVEYLILNYLDIGELRQMRLVCKSWRKIIDLIRIEKLIERVKKHYKYRYFHRWVLFTTLRINCKRNNMSWQRNKKKEDREILLF